MINDDLLKFDSKAYNYRAPEIGGASGGATAPIGGPGSAPLAVAPQEYEAPALTATEGASKVRIYVLDTFLPSWYREFPTHLERGFYIGDNYDFHAETAYESPQEWQNQTRYDHGNFVADIIRRLSPKSSIVMAEAMNKYCVGKLPRFLELLQWLKNDISKPEHHDKVKIINMSLMFDLPLFGLDLIDKALNISQDSIVTNAQFNRYVEEKCEFLESWKTDFGIELQEILTKFLDHKFDINHQTYFFAAAGNNSYPDARRRLTRMPAALSTIRGVTALEGKVGAEYANKADLNQFGYAAQGTWVGPYTNDEPIYVLGENGTLVRSIVTSGYARWSGTSFATAAVVGHFAALLEQHEPSIAERILQQNQQIIDDLGTVYKVP